MTFDTEPKWMQEARKAPLRSTWESRQQYQRSPLPPGSKLTEPSPTE